MHHVLMILTLAFIQGRTDVNHKNSKCLILIMSIGTFGKSRSRKQWPTVVASVMLVAYVVVEIVEH